MKEKKQSNTIQNYLFAISGALMGIFVGFQLLFATGDYAIYKQILGIISIIFWSSGIIWFAINQLKKQKTNDT